MSYEKGASENILAEVVSSKKYYAIEDLKAKKARLESDLARVNALIAECDKLGVKELEE
tara:strand:- start:560 stop:736 length:177 start_codon:yes stop_codon:yes gene_type:complete